MEERGTWREKVLCFNWNFQMSSASSYGISGAQNEGLKKFPCPGYTSFTIKLDAAISAKSSRLKFNAISEEQQKELKKYPCSKCNSVFSYKGGLKYHEKFECSQPPRFYCIYYDNDGINPYDFLNVKRSSKDGAKFPCASCSSVFSRKDNLQYHIKFKCNQPPRFLCGYCNYKTRHPSNARAHIKRKHPDKEVYFVDTFQQGDS
ncbi:zinc finger protein SNAI2-like [Belonocnema kinseyi]|uniref:zinc finger protein SNAI2-like n=1 Tax=Belonocnema kinseyi TaxID=2817044 RepID=UPI00143CF522|nr:zinc finger protein SNAI2-like [Belonocnema kinseyi]